MLYQLIPDNLNIGFHFFFFLIREGHCGPQTLVVEEKKKRSKFPFTIAREEDREREAHHIDIARTAVRETISKTTRLKKRGKKPIIIDVQKRKVVKLP